MTESEVRDQLAPGFALLCRAIANDTQFSHIVASERGILTMGWLPTRTFMQDHPDDE